MVTTQDKTPGVSLESQRGFTLIELSIVLVIIGLIIGGVLKGQEMINSTRLKTTVAQWDATKAAINTFQDKYLALPGDMINAKAKIDGDLTNGDGLGTIGAAKALSATLDAESNNAWAHLQAADLISGIQLSGANYSLPAKLAGGSLFIQYGTFNSRTAHFLRLQSGSAFGTAPADVLNPKDASEIDRKFDDDNAITGVIQADKVGATGTDKCHTTGTYELSDAASCTMVMELF